MGNKVPSSTLCLKIQDPADIKRGTRILEGREKLGPHIQVLLFSFMEQDVTQFEYLSEDEIIMQKEEACNIVGDLGNLNVQKLADSLETCKLSIHVAFAFCNLDSESIKRLSLAIMRNDTLTGFSCQFLDLFIAF